MKLPLNNQQRIITESFYVMYNLTFEILNTSFNANSRNCRLLGYGSLVTKFRNKVTASVLRADTLVTT
jgi:hypothetical protein